MKAPAESVQPQAKRIRSVEYRTTVGARIHLVGIDAPPSAVPAEKVLGVVELPSPPSVTPDLADLVADAVVAKLTATGAIMPPAATTAEPERILISSDEAAALLGVSRVALAKRVERHQVPGVVRTGRKIEFNKAKLIAGLDRRTRA